MIGPIGYDATSSAPARYSGNDGPGTFDTIRLWMGRCRPANPIDEYSRDAIANVRGAAHSPQSVSMRAPNALCSDFAPNVFSAILRTRSIGSAMSVDSAVNMADTLLPPVPTSSSVRTDTGHTASSGSSGSSSRASR